MNITTFMTSTTLDASFLHCVSLIMTAWDAVLFTHAPQSLPGVCRKYLQFVQLKSLDGSEAALE